MDEMKRQAVVTGRARISDSRLGGGSVATTLRGHRLRNLADHYFFKCAPGKYCAFGRGPCAQEQISLAVCPYSVCPNHPAESEGTPPGIVASPLGLVPSW